MLKENGYGAKGVDNNRMMVQHCADLGFDVAEDDVIEFLKKQKAASFAAITGFHIIEHMTFSRLASLASESFRALKRGGVAAFDPGENRLRFSCGKSVEDCVAVEALGERAPAAGPGPFRADARKPLREGKQIVLSMPDR